MISSPPITAILNRIQKLAAVIGHSGVNVWHWTDGRALPYQFWVVGDHVAPDGYSFATFEPFVDAAYARIDPLTTTTAPTKP